MTRKKAEAMSEGGLATTVTLALGRRTETHRFEHLDVSVDDPDHVTVVLSAEDGRKIVVQLPRAEVKKHLSWRMLASL